MGVGSCCSGSASTCSLVTCFGSAGVGGCTVNEAGSGDRGSIALFCLMEMTIFSRSSGDRCFSLRIPRQDSESSLRSSGRAEVGHECVARSV